MYLNPEFTRQKYCVNTNPAKSSSVSASLVKKQIKKDKNKKPDNVVVCTTSSTLLHKTDLFSNL